MSDAELAYLRERAAQGDEEAAARLVELAGERSDSYDLQLIAQTGGADAMDERVRLATEKGDLGELERLAAGGDPDAAQVLDELDEPDPMDDGT
ncbi:hypothetical protein [Agromyces bauzanensis]